jgi:hypothetical protein
LWHYLSHILRVVGWEKFSLHLDLLVLRIMCRVNAK